MGRVDIASKVWLQEAAGDIARLVLRDPQVDATAIGSVTLPSVESIVDGLLRVQRCGARRAWLHAEVQARWKADVPARTFDYWARARKRHWPLRSCVIVLRPDERRGEPTAEHVLAVDDEDVLRFRFRVICVWRLDAAALLNGPPSLLPLVPFARGASGARVHSALERLSAQPDEEHRAELQAILAIFAGSVFPDVRWLGKIPEEILMKSTTVQELERRGERRGEQRGERRGIRRGERRGERRGTLRILETLLRARLGDAFAPFEAPLEHCGRATLERVVALATEAKAGKRALVRELTALLIA